MTVSVTSKQKTLQAQSQAAGDDERADCCEHTDLVSGEAQRSRYSRGVAGTVEYSKDP